MNTDQDHASEDFDGSALRELLTPVVAGHGRGAIPADAIVTAGRRRVAGRRLTVVGGAVALVAAVPLAATALADGSGRQNTAMVRVHPGADGTSASRGTSTGPLFGTSAASPLPPPSDAGSSEAPTLLGSGVSDGKAWSVYGVGKLASDDSAKQDQNDPCIKLIFTQNGHTAGVTDPVYTAFCMPVAGHDLRTAWLGSKNQSAGVLAVGLAPSRTAKVVAHIDGVPPITAAVVPAPGLPDQVLYIVAVPQLTTLHGTYDEYDASGKQIGTGALQ